MNKIFLLENEILSAKILISRGANLIELYNKKLKANIMRSPEDLSDFENKNPYLYGMPLLFPPNRISGGKFTFEGREYIFPINEPSTGCFLHGTLHETVFEVKEYSSTHIICRYNATEQKPYLTFPHAFSIELKYELIGDKIKQTAKIINNSKHNMPVALAFHSTFNTSFTGLADEAYLKANVIKEFERDTNFLPTGNFSHDSELIKKLNEGSLCVSEKHISALFELGEDKIITIYNKKEGITVNYEFGEGYNYLMVYTEKPQSRYICAEPQTWLSNAPNAPFDRETSGFDYISPGNSREYTTTLICK